MHALLIGASPDHANADEIAVLADEADLVIAVDGGLDLCAEVGVRAHLAVGDMDSLKEPALLTTQADRSSVYPSDKDETDLDLALAEARAAGATDVVATGFTGGRIDHTLASMGSFADNADMRPVIRAGDSWLWILSTCGRLALKVEGQGATFSVVALTPGARISIQGAAYDLDHEELPLLGSLGISNAVALQEAVLTVTEGTVLAFT